MNRVARILGLIASLWASDLGFANQVLAAPPPATEVGPERRPEPPRGRGLYGAGIFGVTFGIANIGYGVPLAFVGPGDAYGIWYFPAAMGASFIALGAVGIHYGKRRRKVWQAWQQDPFGPPLVFERPSTRRHVPWLIVGGVTAPLGLATIGLMIPPMTDPVLNTPTFAYVVTAWGAASVVAGVTMLAVGGVASRAKRHLTLIPTTNRDGFGFGLAGRF